MQTTSGAQLDGKRVVALVAALAVGVVFWDSPVLWPLKLLVVMMHESGHALATLVVGGSVDAIAVTTNQGGETLSRLPPGALSRIFVYSAGYVGSAIAGGGMLLATFRFRLRRPVLVATALWIGATTLLWVRDLFTALFCAGMVALLMLVAKYLRAGAVEVLNLFVAAFSALYVVFDLRDDLWDRGVAGVSDAALLAAETSIPAIIWAAIWTVFSLTILAFAVWASVQRGDDYPLGRIR